jgi:hypothetical protein
MSAGNSADKPQFVKNQMLTHDSLNNLVEFSAGRTQRVMRALGLGGTVSGVSWSFDQQKQIINITPGFIIFPDGEVVELFETLTFNEIGTDGLLKYTSAPVTPIKDIGSHLQVSYKWSEHKTSSGCFQAMTGQQRMDLAWQLQKPITVQNTPTKTTRLFKPISFSLADFPKEQPWWYLASNLNQQITLYNNLSGNIASSLGITGMTQIPTLSIGNGPAGGIQGVGILGDVSFEIAFFARRLSLASKSLPVGYSQGQEVQNAITLSQGDIRGRQPNPATIDSLLFEISLCNRVASGSIAKTIEFINTKKSFPDTRPQGVCAQRGNTSISGVFLIATADILKSSCEYEETSEDSEFFFHSPQDWNSNSASFSNYDRVRFVDQDTGWEFSKKDVSWVKASTGELLTISSYQHKSGRPLLLIPDDGSARLGFLKPYREW